MQVVTMVGAGVLVAVVKSRMVVLVVRPAKGEPVAMGERSMEEEKQQKKARGMIQGRIRGREA